MYGRQTYPALVGGTWSYGYVTKGPIEQAFIRVGEIFKSSDVPGGAPKFADRDWLKAAPAVEKIGFGHKVLERFRLSDVGGWLAVIHKR